MQRKTRKWRIIYHLLRKEGDFGACEWWKIPPTVFGTKLKSMLSAFKKQLSSVSDGELLFFHAIVLMGTAAKNKDLKTSQLYSICTIIGL